MLKKFHLPFFICISLSCFIPYVSTPLALCMGLLFGITLGCPSQKLVAKLTKILLQVSVVGLGFGIPFTEVLRSGKEGLLLSFLTIALALALGALLSKFLNVKKNTGALLSVGTAICGGSAIAAIAPVLHADQDDISVSMALVFALNSLALFIFPGMGHFLHLLPEQFGLWCALAIHDTSSVVGASSLFGEKALAIATTVKLSRAMWILPLAVFFTAIKHAKGKITVPWFIFFFIGAAALSSLLPQFKKEFLMLNAISKQALCLVLFWIGSCMNTASLKRVGWRPLILALCLWITLGVGSLFYVLQT